MIKAFIGIDLAIAKRKRLPVSVCSWQNGRLVPYALRGLSITPPRGFGNAAILDDDRITEFVKDATCYVKSVCDFLKVTPSRIAIDAPRAARSEETHRREAEIAMDKAGISCFTTPSASEYKNILNRVRRHLESGGAESRIPHSNQLWMIAGFHLFRELSQIAPCIEVFPQATVRVLGVGATHKSKQGAVAIQLAGVAKHTGWPSSDPDEPELTEISFAPIHDALDAYMSAWVAALDESDRTAFGSPPDDVIWTPRIGSSVLSNPRISVKPNPKLLKTPIAVNKPKKLNQPKSPDLERDCPACAEHRFKRWPFGWDAHAAHRCRGLVAIGAVERKEEFKRRFGHLFKNK